MASVGRDADDSRLEIGPGSLDHQDVTNSGLEILFNDLCRRHGLTQPGINQRVLGKEVDFLFEEHALVVETDSWRYHKTRAAFENDRARDALATSGYRTLRFTDRQIADDSAAVAATVAALLAPTPTARRSAPPGSSTNAPRPSPSARARTARRG